MKAIMETVDRVIVLAAGEVVSEGKPGKSLTIRRL